MSRAIKAPQGLPELVDFTFRNCRAGQDVIHHSSTVGLFQAGPIPFQIRFCPALAKKPKPVKESSRPVDPFASPPERLCLGDVGPGHYLVLNKFPVLDGHFILATKQFEPQGSLLDVGDLEAALACVKAYEHIDGGLFVFFNSGEHSGASQPHRHLQMLPMKSMRLDQDGDEKMTSWEPLITLPSLLESAPFVTFSQDIKPDSSPGKVRASYLSLYRRACNSLGIDAEEQTEGEARISYNLGLTAERLVVCPRRAEGDEMGMLSLNGTVLAGTALVKSEEAWRALAEGPELLEGVLRKIGVERGRS
ncbi:5',5'''-P-1,P-4-tetraphosphate phosphorylase 2 [Ophiocordyceps camponoti-floridani]|uniref:5',5'''-P-1,P-4-tetraphosphate phosphorylase 2 n=1 Tax=Ophiocordyceps camponoti-floridani TaxID=2030778 RepID=A0A8H4VAE6_9HYPO|nr:5',5'''-P-1,P-4-tetraphosphate phosphorylase 2 [Ophiocordyceps camponoti-floridani]